MAAAFALCATAVAATPEGPRLRAGEWVTTQTVLAFEMSGAAPGLEEGMRRVPAVWSECVHRETVGAFLNRQNMDGGRSGSVCTLSDLTSDAGRFAGLSTCVDGPTGGRRSVRMRATYVAGRIDAEMDMTGKLPRGPMSGRWRLESVRTGAC
jgi:hypothetical protein